MLVVVVEEQIKEQVQQQLGEMEELVEVELVEDLVILIHLLLEL